MANSKLANWFILTLMFTKKTVRDIEVRGKTVRLRTMLNVPIKDGVVGDAMRLQAGAPTIKYLLDNGAAVVLISHHSDEAQSFAPIVPVLSKILDKKIEFAHDCLGQKTEDAVKSLKPGDLLMLENLRFHPEEKNNGDAFAKKLASYGQVFVNDDFTDCHREHASMVGIPKYLPAVAGLNVEKEVTTITDALDKPKRPLVAVAAGAKISTKIPIVSFLIKKVDALFIGGAMANTFLAALGKPIGKSLSETDMIDTAKKIMREAAAAHKTLLLPIDVVVTTDLATHAGLRTVGVDEVGDQDIIADIGPKSTDQLKTIISPRGSVIWNGPVGIAEDPVFATGTAAVAKDIVDSGAFSIVGGGDTADYVDGAGLSGKFSFVSTGGGASMELMSGNKLPGVEALLDR